MVDSTTCIMCGESDRVRQLFALASITVVRCRRCALAFRPDPEADGDLKELYSEDYYRSRSGYYFEHEVANQNGNLKEFSDTLVGFKRYLPDRGRLLDVGCGVGIFLSVAREEGWRVAGIDISEFASEQARDRLGLDVRAGTLGDRTLPAAGFDLVTMWDMIEHVPDPIKELQEANRLLKSGGYLFLNTPNEAALLKFLAALCYKASLGLFRYPVQKLYHVYHLFYFTEHNLRQLLGRAGFDTVEVRKSSIPMVKARGTRMEKGVVWAISWLERLFGMEYQLSVIARKA